MNKIGDRWFSRTAQMLRTEPMLAAFIVVALVVRVAFWVCTGRIWEDSLITITAARNVWEGVGLTHHASEPRVHSFTSPISVLIPVVGEAFHSGLLLLRLTSLVAAVLAIYYAYRIGQRLQFHWAAHLLVLGYLACDQLQIFFGMSGMETQVATAIALALTDSYLARRWSAFGVAAGLAAIARPEFIMFLLPAFGCGLLLFHRNRLGKVTIPALLVAGPWYAFAVAYYGSPVPHTIVAKSLSFRSGMLSQPVDLVWGYVTDSWRDYVPFKEFWFARSLSAPIPDWVLKVVLAVVAILFVYGVVRAARQRSGLLAASAAVIGFLIYRNGIVLNSYYMWYLPPFLALAFLVAGEGLSALATGAPRLAAMASLFLVCSYASHLPFSFTLDRRVQQEIEFAVRAKTGDLLNEMMEPHDTVVLEPLGYIGWAAFNKTTFDFPGLSSRVAVQAVKQLPVPNVAGMINLLQPTYAVLRPSDLGQLTQQFPATLAKYQEVVHLRARPGLSLRFAGYEYLTIDDNFRIVRRTRDFDEVVRP